MADPSDNPRFRFRFSVSNLILLTCFVAILFALPEAALKAVVAVAISLVAVLVFLVYYSFPSSQVRNGTVNSFLRKCIGKCFLYSTFTGLIGGIALMLKSMN